jgi:VRR-NUC domain
VSGARHRRRPEDAIARAIEQHYLLRAAPNVFMFCIPNGGYRRPIEAAIMKSLGVRAGVPDTCWIKDGRAYFLEIKAEGGRLSPAQEQTLIALRGAGAMAAHAHGLDQCLRVLEGWALLRGTAS